MTNPSDPIEKAPEVRVFTASISLQEGALFRDVAENIGEKFSDAIAEISHQIDLPFVLVMEAVLMAMAADMANDVGAVTTAKALRRIGSALSQANAEHRRNAH